MPTVLILLFLWFFVLLAGLLLLVGSRLHPSGGPVTAPRPDAGVAAAIPGDGLRRKPKVSVVLPSLSQEARIPWVLENIPEWVSEVVLVDGFSTDHAEPVARWRRLDVVVVHQPIPGKGAAVRAGVAAASSEVVVVIDADGSDPREMHRVLDTICAAGYGPPGYLIAPRGEQPPGARVLYAVAGPAAESSRDAGGKPGD